MVFSGRNQTLVLLALLAGSLGCGSHHASDGNGSGRATGGGAGGGGGGGSSSGSGDATQLDSWVVRGHWESPIASGSTPNLSAMDLVTTNDVNQPIGATVAPLVTFTVSNTGFRPGTPSGVTSYGALAITALLDNNLNVCGTDGATACTAAALRIYTTGTAGAGLWNTIAGYGVPITTSAHVIGLNASAAYGLGNATISATTHVVNLAQFTTGSSISIPLSVDFSNAGAGSYASTLVVEYAVQ